MEGKPSAARMHVIHGFATYVLYCRNRSPSARFRPLLPGRRAAYPPSSTGSFFRLWFSNPSTSPLCRLRFEEIFRSLMHRMATPRDPFSLSSCSCPLFWFGFCPNIYLDNWCPHWFWIHVLVIRFFLFDLEDNRCSRDGRCAKISVYTGEATDEETEERQEKYTDERRRRMGAASVTLDGRRLRLKKNQSCVQVIAWDSEMDCHEDTRYDRS